MKFISGKSTMLTRNILCLVLATIAVVSDARSSERITLQRDHFVDWSVVPDDRTSQPTCVDIPRNMSLCHGIGYTKMRLPNLLSHDTMSEVSQQSMSWVPLLNLRCHPDTQLFLCSLFSPVCVDRPIYPCRSLCERVRSGCAGRMSTYGFPWPDMVRCDKFPVDNDMCITPQQTDRSSSCNVCNQVETYENILDNFCRADFVVKTRIRKVKRSRLVCTRARMYKSSADGGDAERWRGKRPSLVLQGGRDCCSNVAQNPRGTYLVMGRNQMDGNMVPTFIVPWSKQSKALRDAVRMFRKLDCADPDVISTHMIPEAGIMPVSNDAQVDDLQERRRRRKSRKRRREKRRRVTNLKTA